MYPGRMPRQNRYDQGGYGRNSYGQGGYGDYGGYGRNSYGQGGYGGYGRGGYGGYGRGGYGGYGRGGYGGYNGNYGGGYGRGGYNSGYGSNGYGGDYGRPSFLDRVGARLLGNRQGFSNDRAPEWAVQPVQQIDFDDAIPQGEYHNILDPRNDVLAFDPIEETAND